MAEERGPLLATFEDGTQIYKYGILNSRGFISLRIGIFNIGTEFNPNTGTWEESNTASAVTSIGNTSVKDEFRLDCVHMKTLAEKTPRPFIELPDYRERVE